MSSASSVRSITLRSLLSAVALAAFPGALGPAAAAEAPGSTIEQQLQALASRLEAYIAASMNLSLIHI